MSSFDQFVDLDDRVFSVRRSGGGQILVPVTKVTSVTVPLPTLAGVDVLTGSDVHELELGPYGFAWVRVDG